MQFSPEEATRVDLAARVKKLEQLMIQQDIDGVLYGTGANYQYFSGLVPHWTREHEPGEPACLFALARGKAPLVLAGADCPAGGCGSTPWEQVGVSSKEALPGLLRGYLGGRRIGTGRAAGPYLGALAEAVAPGVEIVDAEGLGESLRVIKDAEEIARLRRVVAMTDRVMEMVVGKVRPGISQDGLSDLIRETGLGLGARDVSFKPAGLYVKSGSAATADPFTYPRDKGLVAGTSVAFDFGFVLDGYCSDFGRSFYSGPAPRHIAGAYRALQEAQSELIRQMRPGALRLNELFGVIENTLDERGYGDRLRARLPDGTVGHQIGIELHENPWLKSHIDMPLAAGMVMAIEPKVWLPGEYYLRVEDIVVVTEDGAESLTKYDRELFELPV
jgi:Xaa-Pro aminopeptidase